MSLPRPLENNNQHTLTLSQTCPVQADHLSAYVLQWDHAGGRGYTKVVVP